MDSRNAPDAGPVTARTLVWWLAGGSEVCDFCLQRYAWEVEVRCVACDRPVCPVCVVTVRERVPERAGPERAPRERAGPERFCPECFPGGGRTEGR